MRDKQRKRPESEDESNGLSEQLLSLSLFIVLLAFFIVLNGVSSMDEGKIRETVSSIGFAFGTRIEATGGFEGTESSENENIDQSTNEGNVVERMQALFNASFPGHKPTVSEENGILHVQVPMDDFEAAINKTLQLGSRALNAEYGEYLLAMLVVLINRAEDEPSYRMDIIYNIDSNPAELQNDSPQEIAQELARVSNMATNIQKIGLPPSLLSAGLSKGKHNTLDIYFYPSLQASEVSADVITQ